MKPINPCGVPNWGRLARWRDRDERRNKLLLFQALFLLLLLIGLGPLLILAAMDRDGAAGCLHEYMQNTTYQDTGVARNLLTVARISLHPLHQDVRTDRVSTGRRKATALHPAGSFIAVRQQ